MDNDQNMTLDSKGPVSFITKNFEIGGQYQCYQKNFIERFCLPDIDKKQQAKFCYGEKVDEFLVEYYSLSSSPSSD